MDADVRFLSHAWEQYSTLETGEHFEARLHSSLWGNRTDLSNFTVRVEALKAGKTIRGRAQTRISRKFSPDMSM